MAYISCDIDGILTDYPNCWLDYLASCCGKRYDTIEEAKKYEKDYKFFKHNYRISGHKGLLTVNHNIVDVLSILKYEKKYNIIIATSRPIYDENYPDLFRLTKMWLEKNNVPFDFLEYKDLSACFVDKYDKVCFHIEDEKKYAIPIAQKGVKVFLKVSDFDPFISENVISIYKFDEVLRYV